MYKSFSVVQFNCLSKYLAEAINFPYALNVTTEFKQNPTSSSWENFGISNQHWAFSRLSANYESPSEYFDENEKGTLSLELTQNNTYIYAWEERFPKIIDQITSNDPDLIFLQEVQKDTLTDFSYALEANILDLDTSCSNKESRGTCSSQDNMYKYDGVYLSRYPKAISDGIAILWKKSVFLSQCEDDCQILHYTDNKKKAIIKPLSLVEDSTFNFMAATTHLFWNPDSPLQAEETTQLIEKLNDLKKESNQQSFPIILSGDLNFGPISQCYNQYIQAGFTDTNKLLPLEKQNKFTMHVPRSILSKLTDARQWNNTTITKNNPVLSDYILYRDFDSVDVEKLETGIENFIPASTNGLPNLIYSGSDHFPIGVQFSFKIPSK